MNAFMYPRSINIKLWQFSLLLLVCLISSSELNAQLIINEVCSTNESVADNFGELNDWIEVMNDSENPINLSDYYFSDDATEIYKWQLPSLVIQPGEYEVFFSEGIYADDIHFDFGIAAEGEQLFLSKNLIGMIATIDIPNLRVNHSFGLDEDGTYVYFGELTPGESNSTSGYLGYSEDISFNVQGGFYSSPVIIESENVCPNGEIHFTTDGKFPLESDPVMIEALIITETSVVKFICIEEDYLPSNANVETFLFNVPNNIPVISLTVDHDSLFDPLEGIYMYGPNAETEFPHYGANFWDNRHIRTSFEYFENGERQLKQDVDLKIHGGKSSRNKPQRPLRLTARGKYGNDFMEYPFFKEKEHATRFKHLILRNSGSDFLKSNLRDGFWHQLALKENLDFELMAIQPASVYINAEYWGVMNVRERISEYFLAEDFSIPLDSIIITEKELEPFLGDSIHFYNFKEFALNNDLSIETNYQEVQDQLDIKSYLDYFCTEIFAGNLDWPANNIKYWKPSPAQGKWRYIMYDLDTTMKLKEYIPYDLDMFQFIFEDKAWAVNSKLFIALLENEEFKRNFINRMADLMNTSFKEENLNELLSEFDDQFSPQIESHFNRWNDDAARYYSETTEVIPGFFQVRKGFLQDQIISHFGKESVVNLRFNVYPESAGTIKINTITPELPFSGDYFSKNAIDVTATANEGQEFLRWDYSEEGVENSSSEFIRLELPKSGTLTAVFEDNKNDAFFILQNPVQNKQLNCIFNSSSSGIANLSVFNSNGQLLNVFTEYVEKGKNKIILPLHDLRSGIFFVSINGDDFQHSDKFFIP